MSKEFLLAVAIGAIIIALSAAISTGVGWWAINNNNNACISEIYRYVFAVTVFSTIELGIAILVIVGTSIVACLPNLQEASGTALAVVGFVFTLVSSVVGLAFFIWGIVALSQDNNCRGTPFFPIAIWFVIMGGVGLLRACTRKS
jgi:hypothetical protein